MEARKERNHGMMAGLHRIRLLIGRAMIGIGGSGVLRGRGIIAGGLFMVPPPAVALSGGHRRQLRNEPSEMGRRTYLADLLFRRGLRRQIGNRDGLLRVITVLSNHPVADGRAG
jgi:hypothetical protein